VEADVLAIVSTNRRHTYVVGAYETHQVQELCSALLTRTALGSM